MFRGEWSLLELPMQTPESCIQGVQVLLPHTVFEVSIVDLLDSGGDDLSKAPTFNRRPIFVISLWRNRDFNAVAEQIDQVLLPSCSHHQ